MISQNDGKTEIYIGDEDVLMGFTSIPNVTRVWFAPLTQPMPLNELIQVDSEKTQPPGNEVVTLYFVSKKSLGEFIKGLQYHHDKMRD